MVKVGTKWARRHHADEVYVVRMIEGGQVYLAHTVRRGSTCSIPVESFHAVWAPASVELPVVTVPPELLGLALDVQEARVTAEVDGALRQRMTNVRTDARPISERPVR